MKKAALKKKPVTKHSVRNDKGIPVKNKSTVKHKTQSSGKTVAAKSTSQNNHSETDLSVVLNNTEESFLWIDTDFRVILFNQQFDTLYKKYLGKGIKKGDSILDYAQPNRREIVKKIYERVFKGESLESEITIPVPKHGILRFANRFKPTRDEKGNVTGAFVNVTDTTEWRKAEKLLKEERRLLRTLIDNLPINVYTKDLQLRKTLANRTDYEYCGCKSEEEVLGKTDKDFFSAKSARSTQAEEQIIISTGKSVLGQEECHGKKDGTCTWFLKSKIPLRNEEDEITGLLGISYDISERKEAEEKIRIAKERYDIVVKATNEAIWDWDILTSKLHWEEGFRTLFGYDPEKDLISLDSWTDHIHPADAERVVGSIISLIRSGENTKWEEEYRFMKKDGSYARVLDRGYVIRDAEGKSLRMIGAMQDITQMRKADNALRDSEEKRRLIMNAALDAIICMDTRGKITFWNPQAEKIFGWSAEEALGKSLSATIVPASFRHLHEEGVEKYFATGHAPAMNTLLELSAINKDNKEFPIELTVLPIKQAGEEEFFCAFIRDITDRKKKEQELEKSEQGLKRSQEIAHIGNWEADFVNNTQSWSDETFKVLGFKPGEVEASLDTLLSTVHPEDQENVKSVIENSQRLLSTTSCTHRIIRKDGHIRTIYTEIRFKFDKEGNPTGAYGIHQDITEQKRIEEDLKKKKAQLSVATHIAKLGSWEFNVDEGIFTFNDQFYSILKTSALEMGGYTMKAERYAELFLPPEERAVVAEEIKKAIETTEPGYTRSIEHKVNFPDGETGYLAVRFFVVKDEQGRTIKTVGANQDITDRKKADEQLRLSKERYDMVVKATNDAVYEWDIVKDVNYWGEGFETLFGHKRIEGPMPTESWIDNLHPDERDALFAIAYDAFEKKKTSLSREIRFRCADGTYKTVFDKLVILYDAEGAPVKIVGAMQDITERKKNETAIRELNEQLNKRADQLAASNAELQQFAYIASHDLQEPLRMVSSFLQLLQKKNESLLDQASLEYISYAIDGAARMKRLILDLLEYSRVGTSEEKRSPTDMSEVLSQVLDVFADKILEKSAVIKTSLMPVINANKSQITQLLQNLIGNALKYNTSPVAEIEIGCTEQEDSWQFFVKDNGIGIDPKFYKKVFVIFQRLHNKQQFSGTGIGLAICKKIVERHGGDIWIESELGKGSTFYFTIKK